MDAKVFKKHLENNIIPFWNMMKDDINGGFYGYADSEGKPEKDSVKGCILNSRILWFYSAAYQLLKEPKLLENAEHAYQFLSEHFYDSRYGGVYWSLKADGMPEDTTKHTYNHAFAIYALSVYYQAGGNKDALNLAYDLYHVIESKCRDTKGYFEAFNRDFSPASNDKLSENGVIAERTMNTLLHLLEAYTELYRADKTDAVGDSIREILHIFNSKVFDWDKKICRVFFDKSYNSLIELESYGHDIEASWLIDRACQVLGDNEYYTEMLPIIKQLAERAYTNGMDSRKQAMNNECENETVNATKVWWVQAEAVTGFYNAYQNEPDKTEYLQASENVWNYIQTYVIDKKTGEWIENISPDNTVKSGQALAHAWKCPYHNGRMCIEMIQRLSSAS